MTDGNAEGPRLPPRPSAKNAAPSKGDAAKIIVEVQGHEFFMDPVRALALAGTITATVEIYLRNNG